MEESFGEALARLRSEHRPPLSLRALARLVHYSHVYLWQVERGVKPVTAELARRCDAALNAGGELLALADERETARVRARYEAGIEPVLVEPPAVLALEQARERYEQMYQRTGGVAVRPRLLEYIRTQANPLLDGRYDAQLGARLYRAVASLVALAAACAYDSGDDAAADRHGHQALRLGKASGDRTFVGYVLSLLANHALRTGRPQDAARCADRALEVAPDATPALLADLYCVRAEVRARGGDRQASVDDMTKAYRAAERIDRCAEPPETRSVDAGLLEGRHAEMFRVRGELDSAQAYARASIVIGRRTYPRGMANRYVVLANVLLACGELEQAAAAASDLLTLTEGMESRLMRDRVRAITTALTARSKVTAVREVCERAETLLRSAL